MKRPETKGFSSSSNMLVAELSYKKHVPWIPVPKNPRKNSHPTLPFHRFEKTKFPFSRLVAWTLPFDRVVILDVWSSGSFSDEVKLLFWFFSARNKTLQKEWFCKSSRFLSAVFFFLCFFRVLHMLIFEISQQLGVLVGIYVSNALDLRLTRLFWRLVMQLGGPFQPCGPGPGAISKWAKL